jgi:hypothetical protein
VGICKGALNGTVAIHKTTKYEWVRSMRRRPSAAIWEYWIG